MIEANAFTLHAISNGFKNCEAAMTFIHVQHAGRGAHGPERAVASDAQQQLLADTDARISTIQTRGEFPVLGMIAFDVGIEQIEVAAPDAHAPDFGADGSATGFYLDGDRFAGDADGGF